MISIVENPDRVKRAEIVVGIPSFNEAESIGFVVSNVDEGLYRYFPKKDAIIVNVDANSPDNTKSAFFSTQSKSPKLYISTPKGVTGKGRMIKNLFYAGIELGARAIVMIDADLTSIRPQWIQYLVEPVYGGNDFVIPIYERHKYDGTITNNIAYPLTRALYGVRTRQPIAGDFAFSGKLLSAMLSEKTWTENVSEFGIDIWITTIAIARGFDICQAFMASPKIHKAKDPGRHLDHMFCQVVDTIFRLAIDFEYIWKRSDASEPTRIFGFGLGVREEPEAIKVNKNRLFKGFTEGSIKYGKTWERIIAEINLEDLRKLLKISAGKINVASDLWARILFDYIVAYRDELDTKINLLNSLIPLYYIKTLSFYNSVSKMNIKDAEEFLENECRLFEDEKYYLIARWNQIPRKDGLPSIARFLSE